MSALVASGRDVPVEANAQSTVRYAGLITRLISFVVDAVLIDVVAIIVAAAGALIVSFFHFPKTVQHVLLAIGAGAYVVWSLAYFVAFWSTTGQTPGARVMQIRVVTVDGGALKPRRAFRRCVGVVLATLPLFAGFLPILFSTRRRGFQDWFAATLVVEAPQVSVAQARRVKRRAAQQASRRLPRAAGDR